MTRLTLGMALLVLLSPFAHSDPPTPAEAQAAVERARDAEGRGNARKTLEEIASDYGVPGFSIAVIDNFEVAWVNRMASRTRPWGPR